MFCLDESGRCNVTLGRRTSRIMSAAAALLFATIAGGQPMGPMGPGMRGQGPMGGMGMMSMVRHQFVMQNGIPSAYRSVRNPLTATQENIGAGHRIYESNCSVCHGPKGHGDGPGAQGLNPPPANIAALLRMGPMASDAHLMWTVSEGGEPVGSAMPAFKSSLPETERWQIITFLRKGLGR